MVSTPMNSICCCGSVVDRGVAGIKGRLGRHQGGEGGDLGRGGSATHFGDFTGFESSAPSASRYSRGGKNRHPNVIVRFIQLMSHTNPGSRARLAMK